MKTLAVLHAKGEVGSQSGLQQRPERAAYPSSGIWIPKALVGALGEPMMRLKSKEGLRGTELLKARLLDGLRLIYSGWAVFGFGG